MSPPKDVSRLTGIQAFKTLLIGSPTSKLLSFGSLCSPFPARTRPGDDTPGRASTCPVADLAASTDDGLMALRLIHNSTVTKSGGLLNGVESEPRLWLGPP